MNATRARWLVEHSGTQLDRRTPSSGPDIPTEQCRGLFQPVLQRGGHNKFSTGSRHGNVQGGLESRSSVGIRSPQLLNDPRQQHHRVEFQIAHIFHQSERIALSTGLPDLRQGFSQSL